MGRCRVWVGDGTALTAADLIQDSDDSGGGGDAGAGGGVDGILLDAPCSATGTGRRRPDVLRKILPNDDDDDDDDDDGDDESDDEKKPKKNRRGRRGSGSSEKKEADEYRALLATQRTLGEHCAAAEGLLRAGGVLVFATCSLQRAEGERQADYLATLPQLEPLPLRPGEVPGFDAAITPEGWLRVLPGCMPGHLGDCDGFFVARFRKV